MFLITISKVDRWGREKNFAKLVEALNYEDEEVRKAAALCLGKIGDASLLETLEYAFNTDPNVFVKKDIESAISLIKAKKYVQGKPIFNEGIINLQPVYSYRVKVGS